MIQPSAHQVSDGLGATKVLGFDLQPAGQKQSGRLVRQGPELHRGYGVCHARRPLGRALVISDKRR